MVMPATTPVRSRVEFGFAVAVLVVALLTVIRIVGLHVSLVDLYYDESQYWAWSRHLAFGYFSKPPLLAWVIAGADAVCGSGAACVRTPSPLFYAGTVLLVYAVADILYGRACAFWACLILALAPGVIFSTRIISTDVPLLFFWALALLAYVKLYRGGGWGWTILLGLATGLGLNAKYAMAYFVLGVALAAAFDARARAMLRGPSLWIALAMALALIAPNIWWNLDHGLVTFTHVGNNAAGNGAGFYPLKGLGFIVSQFGVFGPVSFAVLLLMMWRFGRPDVTSEDRLMLAFAIPPLALITIVGFITHANANWAAPAFVSGAVAVAAYLVRAKAWRWIDATVLIGVIVQVMLIVGDSRADRISLPFLAKPDVYARTLGWRALGYRVNFLVERTHAASIVADSRSVAASLTYYLRSRKQPVFDWPIRGETGDYFTMSQPLTAAAATPVLYITACPYMARLRQDYDSVEPLGPFTVPTGRHSHRWYRAFLLAQPKGKIAPLGPCAPNR